MDQRIQDKSLELIEDVDRFYEGWKYAAQVDALASAYESVHGVRPSYETPLPFMFDPIFILPDEYRQFSMYGFDGGRVYSFVGRTHSGQAFEMAVTKSGLDFLIVTLAVAEGKPQLTTDDLRYFEPYPYLETLEKELIGDDRPESVRRLTSIRTKLNQTRQLPQKNFSAVYTRFRRGLDMLLS